MKLPRTLHEARVIWAQHRKKYLEICTTDITVIAHGGCPEFSKNEYNHFSYSLYSLPFVGPFMAAWMIDIKFGSEIPKCFRDDIKINVKDINNCFNNINNGNEYAVVGHKGEGYSSVEVNLEERIGDLLNNPEVFTAKTGGVLIDLISKDIKELGLVITDRGFGCGGGHIGIPCTDNEKDGLINLIWCKYHRAVVAGLIFPKITWFSPIFRDLWEYDDVVAFLNKVSDA